MRITVDLSTLARTRWQEYATRFLLGGILTALTGIIAREYGPGVGGLFLAFPAIFPASATLIEGHERRKKRKAGFDGRARGRRAAAVDAAGASLGALGLLAFAVTVYSFVERHGSLTTLALASAAWFAVAFSAWLVHRLQPW